MLEELNTEEEPKTVKTEQPAKEKETSQPASTKASRGADDKDKKPAKKATPQKTVRAKIQRKIPLQKPANLIKQTSKST